jgi:hypothetical protein
MMNEQLPELLFRFRSLDAPVKEFTKASIIGHELYFSDPAGLNDPYDCQVALDASGTDEEWRRHFLDALKSPGRRKLSIAERLMLANKIVKERRHENLRGENFARITSRFGIVCFSGTMNNLLMWSHYADNHRGLCLMYKPAHDINGVLSSAMKVTYQQDYPKVRIVDLKRGGDQLVSSLLLTKALDWKYEHEYRVIVPFGAKTVKKYSPSTLIGVIMGARSSDSDKREVEGWLSRHPSRPLLHFAELNHTSYGVAFNPAHSK